MISGHRLLRVLVTGASTPNPSMGRSSPLSCEWHCLCDVSECHVDGMRWLGVFATGVDKYPHTFVSMYVYICV